jgi:hypothetical protein
VGLALFVLGLNSILGALIGIAWSGLVVAVTLPVGLFVLRSLTLSGNIVRIGAFFGGTVGFIAVLPLTLSLPWIVSPSATTWEFLVALTLGPGLATVVGQIGGAWGGSQSRCHATKAMTPPTTMDRLLDGSRLIPVGSPQVELPAQVIQFGTRHLLWVTVWLSVLFAIIRLSGVPYHVALSLLVGWIIYQALTLAIGSIVIRRLAASWAQRY